MDKWTILEYKVMYTAWRELTPDEVYNLCRVAKYTYLPELDQLDINMILGSVYGVPFKLTFDVGSEDKTYIMLDASDRKMLDVMIRIVEEAVKGGERQA